MDRKLAFCESNWAGPESPWHIRVVGSEGLKPGGGVNATALCGREIKGWDLPASRPTRDTISYKHVCPGCAGAFDAI
ncbi:hypothetical protein KIH74_22625 [Kineosporia sp. J2-2]|uniref:Uncharacterized protein n=1 Tax=Kineosporia corallincola TaxID=2835133 RepID=A0ABS5TKW6_9ACTN|nr:hypothetical protein [Kineosporia corallincola]MBT0771753.1 hypothetical protein [Kineosporia corallincola]